MSQKGVEDGTFWSAKASDYLRGYFHAAALARYDLRAVAAWVAGADPDVPERILLAAGARQWAHTLAELRSEAHKTAATVRMVMSRALAFMADPALAASVLPGPGDGFDIPAFLDGTGTVYLIAEAVSEEAPVAPLFAAMASEIHWVAAQLGQASSSGRLDPPLLMGLDEVTQICPVPLPFWLSDSGGKGIQVVAVVHGEAQLAGRWGDYGRQVVLDTSSVKVFLPGITDTTTLQAASTLCGQASWKIRGQDHATRHDVATPDMIRQLPAGFALVIRGGCAPVIARLPRAWKNPAYRRARRLGQAPWTAIAELPAAETDPEPDLPDYVPAEWLPGDGTTFPWSLTMTGNDPITAIVDQLAAHAEQLTRLDTRHADHHAAVSGRLAELTGQTAALGHVVQEHAAALTRLTATSQTDPDPDGYRPEPAPAWWKLAAADRQEPIARLRAWVEQVYRPGYGHLAAALGPVLGPPTTCACTAWTSHPSCGRCCTCSPPAAPAWSPPRPNTRPASCPPWPTSSASRPAAAATRATPHRPAASPGARHDRHDAPPGAGLRRPRLAGVPLPARARRPPPPRHGVRDATTDPEQITAWFGRHPDWNLAIATGAPGPDVLDVDEHGHAGNGYAAFASCERRAAGRRGRAYVRTPSGGLHAYFTGSDQRNGHLPGCHLDFRSRGGYVLAPPSQVDGKPYQLIRTVSGRGALDWATVTALLTPAAAPAAPAGPRPRPGSEPPGPVGRQPARRQPQRGPVLGRQPRPGRRPGRRPQPPGRRRPPGLGERRSPEPRFRPQSGRTRTHAPDYQAEAGDQA